jgi:2'-aminobiphenyl-2,3-diol 1,2-dioxygenase, large subunit
MGKLVSAVATSHVMMSPKGAEAQAQRVLEGMLRIGRSVRASRPDVIVIISNDHMFNVGPQIDAPFLMACGERFTPFGEMDIPREEYRGAPAFARGFIEYSAQGGSPIAPIEALRPDHGTAIPLLFTNPDREIAVAPLFVNYDLPRPPSPLDCRRLGELLREFIHERRPQDERVALVAAGGLSHWVGYEDATINEDFDRRFLAAMERGDLGGFQAYPAAAIRREAGNGGLEVMSWMMMAAAVPQARAEIVYYEPMASWMTGMGGVVMNWRDAAA